MQFGKGGFLYILSCNSNKHLYVGVTSDVLIRVHDHKIKFNTNSYSAKRGINKLVYYCYYDTIEEAKEAEYYLKGKRRSYKENLISDFNHNWEDLQEKLIKLDMER